MADASESQLKAQIEQILHDRYGVGVDGASKEIMALIREYGGMLLSGGFEDEVRSSEMPDITQAYKE